jgi:hypothetical protein
MTHPRSGPNPLSPETMSPDARLAEIAHILATGLIRMQGAKSSSFSANAGDSFLDFPAHESGHGAANQSHDGGQK